MPSSRAVRFREKQFTEALLVKQYGISTSDFPNLDISKALDRVKILEDNGFNVTGEALSLSDKDFDALYGRRYPVDRILNDEMSEEKE